MLRFSLIGQQNNKGGNFPKCDEPDERLRQVRRGSTLEGVKKLRPACVSPALNAITWHQTGIIGLRVQLVEGAADNHEWTTCRLKSSVVSKELMKHMSTGNSKSELNPLTFINVTDTSQFRCLPGESFWHPDCCSSSWWWKLALRGNLCLSAPDWASFHGWCEHRQVKQPLWLNLPVH